MKKYSIHCASPVAFSYGYRHNVNFCHFAEFPMEASGMYVGQTTQELEAESLMTVSTEGKPIEASVVMHSSTQLVDRGSDLFMIKTKSKPMDGKDEEEDIYIPLMREEEMILDLQKKIKDLKQRELSCLKGLNYKGSFPPSRKMVCCLKFQLHEIRKMITKKKKRLEQLLKDQ